MTAIDAIAAGFKKYFDTPGLELPAPIPARGELGAGGWSVTYVLTHDAAGAACLDFFARNRLTNSRHVRIDAAGQASPLENYQDALIFEAGEPEDWGKAAARQADHNRKVTEILEAKGLLQD